jgi:hypothetical protein
MPTESRRQLVIEKHIIIYLYAFGDSIRNIITDGLPNKNGVPNKKKKGIHFISNSICD